MSFPIFPDSLQHLLLHTSPSLIAFCRTHLGGVNRDATAPLGQAGGRHGASELEPGPRVMRSASAEPEGRKTRGPAPLLGRAARLRLPVCALFSECFTSRNLGMGRAQSSRRRSWGCASSPEPSMNPLMLPSEPQGGRCPPAFQFGV